MKSIKIGIDAPEVIAEIIDENLSILSVFYAIYSPASHLKPTYITSKLLRHNPPRKFIELKREDVFPENIKGLASHFLNEFELLAFVSKVRLQGEQKFFHFPLIDFRCENSTQNLERLRDFLREINQKRGVILFSGVSYHYYGLEPLSELDWGVFLGQCLLSGLVDHFYIGHQMVDKCSILRITQSNQYPEVPTVVSVLNQTERSL